jgi:DNA-binding winged helix-turn-helix (wHTH) protein
MSKPSNTQADRPFPKDLFNWPYAEDEEYLEVCFVPMPEFDRMRGEVSVLVFGEPGSGKTALFKALKRACFDEKNKPTRLLVEWHPVPLSEDSQDSASMSRRMVLSLLDACAVALTEHLAAHPQALKRTPDWAPPRLFWFIRHAIQGDLSTRLGPILSMHAQSTDLLDSIRDDALDKMFYDPSPEQTLTEALIALKEIALNGIWVLDDGFEAWAEIDPDRLGRHLKSFLSALSLFEQSGLKFKFVLPASLEMQVKRARAANSRRLVSYKLGWNSDLLKQIIEKRLSLVFNREGFSISDLCNAPGFPDWLERIGNTPRQWLEQFRPLVEYRLQHQPKKPIDDAAWKHLRAEKESLPELWVDETGHNVKVGGREVALDGVSPQEYNVLRYLYKHLGEVVGKDALYFMGYLDLTYIPRTVEDKNYASPAEYTGLIDTIIYRLRQAIEPDPSGPVLLQTVRGHGIRLVSR